MWAVIANGRQKICTTQKELDVILAIYPYPKFRKCTTTEEARKWLLHNQRGFKTREIINYGDTAVMGYATVQYEIKEERTLYQVDTRKIGFLRVRCQPDVLVDGRRNQLLITCTGVSLHDELISHHVIAIHRIVKILGPVIDLNIVCPDMSVYLALTRYTGKDYNIRSAQEALKERIGAVAYTVERR